MGNETSGFAVLNLSTYTMHMGLSMAGTHYYENNVNHGEIFYRWPGAVHYTVYAQTSPEISRGTCAKEIAKSTAVGIASVAVAAITLPLPALSGPAASLIVASEGGATSFAVTSAATAGLAAGTGYRMANGACDVLAKVDAADLYAEMKRCYGGGSGTWLVLRGGLKRGKEQLTHEKLWLEAVEPEYILANGKFTSHSQANFYTTKEAKKHKATGHDCRRASCNSL